MVYTTYFKRFFDVVFSLSAMLFISWFFLFLVLVYVISFNLPIFYAQQRIGKDNAIFRLIKFRTLKVSEGSDRRFFLGNILRFFSLDELPQLWNVLKGNMSLIGPRPLPVEYKALFSEEQLVRHTIRPGITGWAQVNGRHSISWSEKFELDIYYVKHVSFGLDMLILFKTIVLLLSFKKDQSLTEEKFKGN